MWRIVLLCLVLVGCGPRPELPEPYEYRSVVRVLMSNPWEYTIFVQNDNHILTPVVLRGNIQVIADVPADQPMWAKYWKTYKHESPSTRTDTSEFIEIHIHDGSDINGTEHRYQSGKQTVVKKNKVVE